MTHDHDHSHSHSHNHDNEHSHSHDHSHDHGNNHDHSHNNEHNHNHDQGPSHELTLEQKLEKLLGHWINHNDSHKDTFFNWAQQAEDGGLEKIALNLKKAGELSQEVTMQLKDAFKNLG